VALTTSYNYYNELFHRDLLVLGLQDGRLLFMDQMKKGKKHLEILIAKDPIKSIKFDPTTCRIYTCSCMVGYTVSNIQVRVVCVLIRADVALKGTFSKVISW